MTAKFIAHVRKDREPQYLVDHLKDASEFSGQFAGKIGLKNLGELLGLLHDLGKFSKEFQNYIRSAEGLIDPDQDEYVDAIALKGKVDHSSAGAQTAYRKFGDRGPEGRLTAQVLALCIASHHSGLIDCLSPNGEDNYSRRIEKSEDKTHADEALSNLGDAELKTLNELLSKDTEKQLLQKLKDLREENDSQETIFFKYGLLIRFLFSCLIDADRLSTADFESPNNADLRNYGQYHPWSVLVHRLDNKLREFEIKREKNEVDELRTQVSRNCFEFSTSSRGIFQLTVPTGGGKTLASLRFALNHAARHNMDRIFYIIPYTSIIDQNADEVRKILEDRDENGNFLDKVVLEHHSNLTPEEETRRNNLLSENWDAPIVFTTQVQFLEALFGSGTRSVRRMHQLANSVIIFDEVQTIPVRCVHMFNLALRFLVKGCGASVVLCTATQPLLDKIEPVYRALQINKDQKIIPDEQRLFNKLTRVEVFDRRKVGGWTDQEVAELAAQQLREMGSVLMVVNTKNSARSLYQAIDQLKIADVYHLSTNMCPANRLDVLSAIKEKLDDRQPVLCVSTQLIEAGVDIDFGSVIRFQAGLDSIVQAAGRCNRHGIRRRGNVWIVNPIKENIERLVDIRVGIEKTERVLGEYRDNPDAFENNPIGLQALAIYYQYYFYERRDEMGYPVGTNSPVGRQDDLFNLLSVNTISVAEHQRITRSSPVISFKQSFQAAAKSFFAIDSPTRGVIVPYKEQGQQIISDLCGAFEIEKQFRLLKKAQRYTVNLFPHEFKKLAELKAIREVQTGSGIFYLDDQYYNKEFGWSNEIVNDMPPLIY